ncbi:MAG: hypothetical protein AAB535_00880 [Patescibacteria group bacterium]
MIERIASTIELNKTNELSLPAIPPFNFKYTVYKPSHFPTRLEESDEASEAFYRTYRLNEDKILGLKMSDLEKKQGESGIFLEVYSANELDRKDLGYLENHVNGAYGLKEDINEFYEYVKSDEELNVIIDNLRGMRNSCFETLFEILNISSILQNTTVKRSEQMMKNMLSSFGERVIYDGKELYTFYTPEDILNSSEERLRELKVGYRAKFLMEIARRFLQNPDLGEKLKTMNFEDAKETLMEIKGVGPYSARIALFQYLRRPHEINFDSWKRKIFSKFFFGNEGEVVEKVEKEVRERWGNYGGYAGLYVIEDLYVKNPELQYWRKDNKKI